jgi:ssDNA-specific exonuclease RecJ
VLEILPEFSVMLEVFRNLEFIPLKDGIITEI